MVVGAILFAVWYLFFKDKKKRQIKSERADGNDCRRGREISMAELHEIEVTAAGWRADKLIAEALPELSRSAVQNLIRDGHVTCDNKIVQKSAKLAPGSVLCVEIPEARPLDVKAENIPLDIVYEDDDLLVVNKPKGMVVHPAAGNYDGTLVNALLYHCGDSLSGINGVIRPGIVHRIDKNTSGLLIVAKNDTAHRHFGGADQGAQLLRANTAPWCTGKFARTARWMRPSHVIRRTESAWRYKTRRTRETP